MGLKTLIEQLTNALDNASLLEINDVDEELAELGRVIAEREWTLI